MITIKHLTEPVHCVWFIAVTLGSPWGPGAVLGCGEGTGSAPPHLRSQCCGEAGSQQASWGSRRGSGMLASCTARPSLPPIGESCEPALCHPGWSTPLPLDRSHFPPFSPQNQPGSCHRGQPVPESQSLRVGTAPRGTQQWLVNCCECCLHSACRPVPPQAGCPGVSGTCSPLCA